MEQTTFFEHYRICEDDAAREVSRTGAAINYKAIDTRSHAPVLLQLIPVALVDSDKLAQLKERAETAQKLDHVNIAKTLEAGVQHEYFAVVTEYSSGEMADEWIAANGPMAADSAVRAGLQIVRALGAAAFFNLSHRALQPSNLMIVPGQSPDGGWPYVKLLNFGLAGLELHSDSAEARELAPSISPQFASPEQRANGEIDFRSEMYSLGATMCFLLTGAAPLAVSGMKARFRIQRLPELRRAPKPLHDLLVHLLRENPENRPQDPVALEKEMRECLTKIERRQAIGRKFGLPLAAVIPRKAKERKAMGPITQVLGGFVAVVALLLAAVAGAEYFFPDKIPFLHHDKKIGVQIGVPDAAKFAANPAPTPNNAAPPINQPSQSAPPIIADAKQNPPVNAIQNQTPIAPLAQPTATPAIASNTEVAAPPPQQEPAAPALGPNGPPVASAPENSEQPSSAEESSESTASSKSDATGSSSNRRSTSRTVARNRDSNVDQSGEPPAHSRRHHAEVLGHTANGGLVVRLSNGQTVVLPPLNNRDVYRPRHRVYTERPDDFVPPSQPFNQNY
jgi:serine/threonine protein kinase